MLSDYLPISLGTQRGERADEGETDGESQGHHDTGIIQVVMSVSYDVGLYLHYAAKVQKMLLLSPISEENLLKRTHFEVF